MKIITLGITACILSVCAGILAHEGKDGWGWFILGAMIATVIVADSKK